MRFIPLFVISIALVAAPLLEAQSAAPTPAASPAQTKKHKHKKDLQANAATTTPATAAASPAPNAAPGSSPAPGQKRSYKKSTPPVNAAPTPPAVAPTAAPSNSSWPGKKHSSAPSTTATAGMPTPGVASGSAKPAKPLANTAPAAGGGNGLVWVNTQTHVYHKQGSRYYGKTKQGKYVSEQEAMAERDRPAAKGE
jgi:hypothetical protein